jgi:hypothetical protein
MLPGKGNSNSLGARSAHLIITMKKWSRTSKLSIKKSLSLIVLAWVNVASGFEAYGGTSPVRKCPSPEDPPRTLGIGLL